MAVKESIGEDDVHTGSVSLVRIQKLLNEDGRVRWQSSGVSASYISRIIVNLSEHLPTISVVKGKS